MPVSGQAYIDAPPYHRDYRNLDRASWLPTEVDPTARLEAFVVVCCGTVRPTTVGARSWLMSGSHVGHDCVIGCDVEISANVTLCGFCEIADEVKIGAGATLRPFVKVGRGARIGAGAVVVKDVPAGEVWVGNPAENIRRRTQKRDDTVFHAGFPVG